MRVFIAVDIPEWAKEKISYIQDEIKRNGVKLVEQENLHITIAFIGEVDISGIEDIKQRMHALETINAVKAKLHGISWFPEKAKPRVIYADIHSKQFKELGETIRYMLGIESDFTPHLTIARVKGFVDNEYMKKLSSLRDEYIGEIEITKVKLKKSVLLPTRPVYTDVFSWTLKK